MGKNTPGQVKREINKHIRLGRNEGLIKIIMGKELDPEEMSLKMLNRLIEDCVSEHPSYDLIQKIWRSKLVVDRKTKDELLYIIDPLKIKVDIIHRTRMLGLFYKPDFSHKTYVCNFEYAPDKMNRLFKTEEGLWNYNLYNAPDWLENNFHSQNKEPIPKSELPEMYSKFLNHLVNNDENSFTYVLDWLATGMRSRNYTILTTIGNQGIGKGVLGEMMRLLFGSDNFYKTECRLLTKDFNKQILNKKLVYIDELKIKNASEENKIKTLVNDYIEIEGKGVDAMEIKNHASIYVSSNDFDAIRLRGDDRRFSVIELTKQNLLCIMSEAEISKLLLPENIEKLAFFLYHRSVSRNMAQVFISKRTEEVRESSLKNWEEWFLDNYVGSGKSVKMKSVTDEIMNEFGAKCNPSKAGFKRVQELYPDKFNIIRKQIDDKRVWYLEFGDSS